MGILGKPSNHGMNEQEPEAPETHQEDLGSEVAGKKDGLAVRVTVQSILSRFDVDDKDILAKELAQALELKQSDSLIDTCREVLGDGFGKTERFRLEILSKILEDQSLLESDASFPDDFGAPKYGL